MKFQIKITETLQRVVEVDAEVAKEAEAIARKLYRSEMIVLDSNDFIGADFEVFTCEK